MPRSFCRAQGLHNRELANPNRRSEAHRAVTPLFDLARQNLDRALDYALTVPPEHRQVRLFCLLPLWLAVRTVARAQGNDAMFRPEEQVKVTREEVEEIIARCTRHVDDDAFLRDDYESMWVPVSRGMSAGWMTYAALAEMEVA